MAFIKDAFLPGVNKDTLMTAPTSLPGNMCPDSEVFEFLFCPCNRILHISDSKICPCSHLL